MPKLCLHYVLHGPTTHTLFMVICVCVFMSHTLCPSAQAPPAPPPTPLSLSSTGSEDMVPPLDSVSSSTPPDSLSGLAKRLCGTPERIALENYRPCLQEEDSSLQEVPEETLAQHNLSLSLQEKGSEEQSRYYYTHILQTHSSCHEGREFKNMALLLVPICNVAMFSPSFSLGSSSESELEEEGEEPWRRVTEPQTRTDGETELESVVDQSQEEEKRKDEKEGEEQDNLSEEEEEEDEAVSSDGKSIAIIIHTFFIRRVSK